MMLLSAPATRSSGAPILAAGGAALGADVGGGERIAPLAAGRGRLKRAASAASSSVGAAPKRRPPLPKSRAKRAAPPAAADDPAEEPPPRSSPGFDGEGVLLAALRSQEARARALVGTWVLMGSKALREKKGVPCTPLEVRRVSRRSGRILVGMRGENARGQAILYTDSFEVGEDVGTRYLSTAASTFAPVQPEAFCAFAASGTAALARARQEVFQVQAEPLERVLPRFQFDVPPARPSYSCLGDQDMGRLQFALAAECSCFRAPEAAGADGEPQGTIWRATTRGGLHFDSSVESIRERAAALLAVQYTKADVCLGRLPVPLALSVAGAQKLHPWQTRVYAEFLHMASSSSSSSPDSKSELLVAKRLSGAAGGEVVRGILPRPNNIYVCVAAPGEGKTRVAALCALGRSTLVVVVKATVAHWRREAALVGCSTLEVGNGASKPAQARRSLEANPAQMWILTREVLARLLPPYMGEFRDPEGVVQHSLPTPELIVVDEIHELLQCGGRLLRTWPSAKVLGLSGTFGPEKVRMVAAAWGLDAETLEAATVRVPHDAIKGVFPRVRVLVKELDMSDMEKACYHTQESWMLAADRRRLLIFAPGGDVRTEGLQYGAEVWHTIVTQLQRAERDVSKNLASIVSHVFLARRPALLQLIASELGEEAATSIHAAAQALPPTVVPWCPAEVQHATQAALARRAQILGGYSFLVKQLDSVAAGSAIDCPVCLETRDAWCIARCGHVLCSSCAPRLSSRCPTCRTPSPAWRSARDVSALRNPVVAAVGEHQQDDAAGAHLNTSNKLKALAGVLLRLQPAERALVICPSASLKAVAAEMRRVGISLGTLGSGSASEQERTQVKWTRGEYRGLLAPPGILGVDVHATTVVFLTTVMGNDAFRQALARVVRQGNPAVERGQAVTVWFLIYRGTEEHDEAELRNKKRIAEANNC